MSLSVTPLDALHRELGARMVPFAGYDMPVQYPAGIIAEHQQTRAQAGLFDVSHMGQLILEGAGSAELLETLVPADVAGLPINGQTYALLTNDDGGVLDDLIITRWGEERFFLVVNAACKAEDTAYLRSRLNGQSLIEMEQQALLALQGPAARSVMADVFRPAAELLFMQGCTAEFEGSSAYITCSGYTGEDGFEISLPAAHAEQFARRLLAYEPVSPVGLGARDSLRLEAGLCLYGHELATDINLVDAGLFWSVGKARRPGAAREGGFPGSVAVFARHSSGPVRRRVGLVVDGKRPVRDGQAVQNAQGESVGEICSACYAPSVGGPIAMAYVSADSATAGTGLFVDVRGKLQPVTVSKMPFVPQRYYRGSA